MPEKIRYEVDPYNRLVSVDNNLPVLKQRRVIDGKFAIGRGNSLEYRVKSPAGSSEDRPYQVKLQGSWSLTRAHDLKFNIEKSAGGYYGDALTISGDLIDIKGDALLFSVTTKRSEDIRTTYILELTGIWQADNENRISFRIRREDGVYDTLAFDAGWDIGKDNTLIYSYEKSRLKRKLKSVHSLFLKGRWKIARGGVLAYEVGAKADSTLNFKASLGACGEDYIKYEIGMMLSGRVTTVIRTVKLTGTWRIRRGSALFFDVEYDGGKVSSVSFSAEAKLTARDTITFRMKEDVDARDLGIRLELDHKLLKGDGAAFLRALHSREESSVVVGAGFKW